MKKIILLLVALLSISQSKSQTPTFVSSITTDDPLDLHNHCQPCSSHVDISDALSLSCDMYHAWNDNEKFWATAYEVMDLGTKTLVSSCGMFLGTPVLQTGIHAEWTGFLSLNERDFCLPNATDPDIVIGDDLGPGATVDDKIIGIVYNNTNGTDVEIATMDVNDLTDNIVIGRTVNAPTIGTVLNTGSRTARNPRIDLFGDANNTTYSYQIHALNKFIVTWTEHDASGPADYIMAAIGDLNNPGSFSGPYTISSDGISPDVGALGINGNCCGTTTDYAYITYIEASTGDLKLAELDITGTTLNGTTISTLSVQGTDHSTIEAPRIEARAFADPTDGNMNWQVAVSLIPYGGSDYKIRTFNNVTTTTTIDCGSGEQHWSPAVAGVGDDIDPTGTGRVGETNFSVAYYSTYNNGTGNTNGDVFANEFDMSTGALASSNYYEVNNTLLMQSFSSSSEVPVAMASSSNSGDDLLVMWYSGDNISNAGFIMYQFGGNSYSFKPGKPTSVENYDRSAGNVYPNPATSNIFVQHSVGAAYEITDAMGKQIMKGTIDTDNHSINTSHLPSGFYMLYVIRNGETKPVKFIKQ